MLWISPRPVAGVVWIRFLTVLLVYLSVRLWDKKLIDYGLWVILGAGLLESGVVLLQHWGFLPSRHLLFNHTGTFFNPGLAGGFIACCFCVVVYFFTQTGLSFRYKTGLGITAFIHCYALLLTDSRAGWIAAAVGCGYVLWRADIPILTAVRRALHERKMYRIGIIVLLASGIFLLYRYKQSSADGRLFIWQNCLQMAQDKPMLGHGIGTFQEIYPVYQARFFMENEDSSRAMVAGSPHTPFNEYLSVLTGQGIIGIILLTGLLLSVFLYKTPRGKQGKQKGFLLAFCVFAFFSYPTADGRMLALFAFFLAILPSQKTIVLKSNSLGTLFFLISMVCGFYFACTGIKKYFGLEKLLLSKTPATEEQYRQIRYDRDLLRNYHFFTEDRLSADSRFEVLRDYVELSPSPSGLCELGRQYKVKGHFSKAEECFIFASNINPSLITPNYELFLLYEQNNQEELLKKTGEKILRQPLKKEGTASLKMKAYVKNVLQNDLP